MRLFQLTSALIACLAGQTLAEFTVARVNGVRSDKISLQAERESPKVFPTLLRTTISVQYAERPPWFLLEFYDGLSDLLEKEEEESYNHYSFRTYLFEGDSDIGTFFGIRFMTDERDEWTQLKDHPIPQLLNEDLPSDKQGWQLIYEPISVVENPATVPTIFTVKITAIDRQGQHFAKTVDIPCIMVRSNWNECKKDLIELDEYEENLNAIDVENNDGM